MRYMLAFFALHIVMVFAVLTFVGCGPTGISPIDNVTNPRKACTLDVSLENQGTQPLTMTAALHASTSDADCEGGGVGYATGEKVVSAGATDRIHLELQCRGCYMTKNYGASKTDKSVLYTEANGSPNMFCSDTVCLGK